jgi:hypothetical protein
LLALSVSGVFALWIGASSPLKMSTTEHAKIKCCFTTQIFFRDITKVGKATMKETVVFKWHKHKRFVCHANVDDPHYGQLSTSTNDENIGHMHK